MPHRLSGYRVPSVCHASGVTAPPNFQSQCAIHSPCQRSGRPTNPAVTVCHLLTAMAMYPPCRLSGHRVSPAHYDDSVHPADFTVTVCHPFAMMAVWLSCRLSGHRVSPARHNGYVPAVPTFWSPCITRSPRWRSTHLANFTVTVSSARRDGGILPRQLSYHYVLSASRECDVLAQPTLQSPMSKALAREPNKRYSERLMLMIHYSYVI